MCDRRINSVRDKQLVDSNNAGLTESIATAFYLTVHLRVDMNVVEDYCTQCAVDNTKRRQTVSGLGTVLNISCYFCTFIVTHRFVFGDVRVLSGTGV